ncbi:MAG: dihydroorotate dehydrogenase [candidate division WOR-3 bacterium]|nr:dihydroorotate dehydrogenase [candidate division WOR-3 bacterium]MCX7837228.1 dihydroorotate dehydrogenase [candidate division WOR-3 bacterium]MDW8113437.1 dihydroorotate dehydrogenase [candidate division WOR-3 bacterium]
MNLSQKIKNINFQNPILLASGTYGFGLKFKEIINLTGGIITKTITFTPITGNPPPRIYEFEGGIINSIGLENPGAIYFKNKILPNLKNLDTNLILSVGGTSIEEIVKVIKILDDEIISAYELNLSCPNVKEGGISLGQNPKVVEEICKETKKITKKPIIAKIPTVFCNPIEISKAAERGGADFITITNTIPGLVIDIERQKPFLGGISGGISGTFLKYYSLYLIAKIKKVVKIPIIGCGGIRDYKDVLEYLFCGAMLVEIGTLNLLNPFLVAKIIEDLKKWGKEKEIKSIKEIIKGINIEI